MITETSSPVAAKLCSPRVVLPMLAAITLLAVIVVLIQMDSVELNPQHHHKPSPIQRKLRNVHKKKDCVECKAQEDKLRARITEYQKHLVALLKANQVLQEKLNDTLLLFTKCIMRNKHPTDVAVQEFVDRKKPDENHSNSNHSITSTRKRSTNATAKKTKTESRQEDQSMSSATVQEKHSRDNVTSKGTIATNSKTTHTDVEIQKVKKLKVENHSSSTPISLMSDHAADLAYRDGSKEETSTQDALRHDETPKPPHLVIIENLEKVAKVKMHDKITNEKVLTDEMQNGFNSEDGATMYKEEKSKKEKAENKKNSETPQTTPDAHTSKNVDPESNPPDAHKAKADKVSKSDSDIESAQNEKEVVSDVKRKKQKHKQ